MGVPGWLSTDPVEAKPPPRARPGWAPRPNKTVRIVSGWQVPERGAGQDDEESAPVSAPPTRDDWWKDQALNPAVTPTPIKTSATPDSLTSPAPSDTVSPESNASTLAPQSSAAPSRSVLPSRPAPQANRSQSGISSGASAPPPQGSSAATSTSSRNLAPNQQDFFQQNASLAINESQRSGIPYQVYLGIAANETGWGSSSLARDQHNYFSIKGQGPSGSTTLPAWEVVNGQNVTQTSSFRAYADPAQSYKDFTDFLNSNPRYKPALNYLQKNPNDWRGFVHMLNDEGYATDPSWADKVISIGSQVNDSGESPDPKMRAGQGITSDTGIQSVLSVGSQAIGQKYQFGGAGGRGQSALQALTDCSGFVSWAYETATGVRLPAQTQGIYASTQAIAPKEAMPGDLVMFNMGQGANMEHVGIYAGNGMMLHDSSLNPDGGVDITPIWSGAEFRRVPGVDPSLVTRGQPANAPDQSSAPQQWVIEAQHGHQVWVGTMPDGRMSTQDLGPLPKGSTIAEGTVLDSYMDHQGGQQPTDQGGGNEGAGNEKMGAGLGQGEDPPPWTDESGNPEDRSYPTGERSPNMLVAAPQPDDPKNLVPKWDGGDVYPWTSGVRRTHALSDPRSADVSGPPDPGTTQSWTQWEPEIPVEGDTYPYMPARMPNYVPQKQSDDIPVGAGQEAARPSMSKKEASYTKKAAEDHCGDCSMFRTNTCSLVKGYIHAGGSCDYFEPKRSKMGAGADGDSEYVDEQGNPVSQTDVNQAALTSQRHGEQSAGYQSVLDTPGQGYQIPTNADVQNAQAQDQYTSDQASIQDESAFLARQQHPAPPPQPKPIPDAPPVLTRPPGSPPPPANAPQPVRAPQPAPQTGQGTARHAITLPPTPPPLTDTTDRARPDQPVQPAQQPPTDTSDQAPSTPTTQSPLAQSTGMPVMGPGATLQAAEHPTIAPPPSIPPLINMTPENQAKLSLAAEVASDVAQPGRLIPGVIAAAQNVYQNGYDPQPALAKLMAPPDPGTASHKAVSGQQLTPLDAVQLGTEWQQRMNDYRADLVRAAQPSTMLGTPEGEAVAQGIALVTDPMNFVGLGGEVGAGRALLEDEGPAVAAKLSTKLDPLIAPVMRGVERTLATPYEANVSRSILQQASLDIGGEEGTRLLNNSRAAYTLGKRIEPLSGEQLRRTVVNAVARANPKAAPAEIIAKADATLYRSAPELTSEGMAMSSLAVPHIEGLEAARMRWYDTPAAQAARVHELGLATKFARGDSGAISTGLALRVMGAGTGALATSFGVDPNDPYRNYKIAGGALVGGLGPVGLAWAAGHVYRGFDATVLKAMREFLSPVENLSTPVRDAIHTWAGTYNVGSQSALRLADEMRGAFGRGANLDLVKEMEEKGRLPFKYMRNPAAQEFFRKWKALTAWSVKYDIVPKEINFVKPGSKAKMYVPHATSAEMQRALEMGQGVAKQQHSRTAPNPFDYFNEQRVHETIQQGEDAGVKYEENVPRTFGNYYSTAVKRSANEQLVNKLMAIADKNNPSRFGSGMQQVMLAGEDVVRLPQGWKGPQLTNAVNIHRYMPQFDEHEGIFISRDLAHVFDNLFNPSAMDRFGATAMLPEMNNLFKHNVLGGSAFHLINETRQVFAAQGFHAPGTLISMVRDMTLPGGARKFWTNEGPNVSFAIRDGLMLNLAADKPAMDMKTRFITTMLNGLVGGAVGYQSGTSDQERQANALKGALAGGAAGLPILAGKSFVERFSSLMWDRYIPFMKYTTYQMYAPQYGGRAAAEFANEVFGGQNLLAIGRSRTMQDAMKLVMLAPDWQEGWARQIGNAAFDWGGNAPLGSMNRHYWGTAIMQSAALLEGMNLAFSGHFSWQNDPDATLLVDMSGFYDKMGWQHRDPGTGNTYKPYLDVLGPYRSMLQPLVETARAATAAGANAMGIPPGQMPFDKEIRGKFGEVPESDPGTQWKNFLGSRVGFLPVLGQQLASDRDWAGRPLDQPDDGVVQRAMTRVAQASGHMIPTGEQQILASGQRGDPGPMALFSAATGARVKHESDTNRFFAYQDQYVKDLGKTPAQWQDELNTARDDNNRIDQQVEIIQSGLLNKDGSTAKPGESDMTPRDRDAAIQKLSAGRKSEHTELANLIPSNWSAADKATYQAQLKWLGDQSVVGGSSAPADFDLSGRPDLNADELIRQAWNRDPDEIARITGTQPPTTDRVDAFGRAVQNWVLRPPAGSDATKQLAQTRARWTTETALTWNVDPAVMQDMVKAKLYGLPDGQLPMLPGVTSSQLNDITRGYQDAGQTQTTGPIAPAQAAQQKQDYIFETAGQLGVDPQSLLARVRLRTLPMADQTPAALQRSNALDLLSSQKAVPFQNPDGSPMGDPKEWADMDNQLAANKDKLHYSKGLYYSNGKPNDKLNTWQAGKQQAAADRYKLVLRSSPDVNDPQSKAYAYYRNFGDGSSLTDAQWQQYQNGTLPMWTDNPSPTEAKRRVAAMRVGAALTKDELFKYQQKPTWDAPSLVNPNKIESTTTTLGAYLAYIRAHKSPQYKDITLSANDDAAGSGDDSGVP